MLLSTPVFRLYAAYRKAQLAGQDAVAVQELQLRKLLRKAEDTRFGRDHGFADIRAVPAFQKRVPLRRYEDFWDGYWKNGFPVLTDCCWPGTVPYFAVTSGTTRDATKYIPCTNEMNAALRWAGADLMVHHVLARPDSDVFGGKSFMLGGSTDLVELAPGVKSGDLSGIMVLQVPWWARSNTFPPRELALLADWEEKIDILARRSVGEDIRSISGTPSWLLIFFDRLAELHPGRGRRLVEYYPRLDLLVHGGVNFTPYRKHFEELLEGSRAELREVYPASEGFIAMADRGEGEGLRLVVDNGIFFEFVPVDELGDPAPARHWLGTVERDVNYAVIVTTCAGLWSYVIGDTVKFIDLDPPRVLITGRTSYFLSAFGEHLIDEEIEDAITAAADFIGAMVADYSVGAVYPQAKGELGGHLYVIEFTGAVPERAPLGRFAAELDRRLCARNDDYKAHRAGGYGMKPPEVRAVQPGTFAAWMKRRGKLGGQHKVPRIITDPDLFADLRRFAKG